MRIFDAVHNRVRKLRTTWQKSKYTPATFAEYLRSKGAQVGEGCYIANFEIDIGIEPYLIKIGNHVAIAGGVSLMTHDGAAWIFRHEVPDLQVYGPVVIEDNCFIGYRAIICPNVRIGRNSIVGAGSVVVSDVPPDSLVMGIPARPFGSIQKYREKCLQRWEQQRPLAVSLGAGETWWTSPHLAENRDHLREQLMTVFGPVLSDAVEEPKCALSTWPSARRA
jgi:acetyltransferase-like isoleucine patch superfamily enzyme